MGLARFVARAVGALVTLGVIGVALAVLSVPLIVLAGVAAAVGAAVLLTAGMPIIIAGALVVLVVAAVLGTLKLGLFALKVLLFGMLLMWLARKVFGWGSAPRYHHTVLVGAPVVDVAAPQRDKYDIAAERELDRELGL